jgi:hypothetical protein
MAKRKQNREIGNLESCIIVVDYNPQVSDDLDIRCFKDRNEAREHGYTNPRYLDKHAIRLGDIIKAIKKEETFIY